MEFAIAPECSLFGGGQCARARAVLRATVMRIYWAHLKIAFTPCRASPSFSMVGSKWGMAGIWDMLCVSNLILKF